MELVLDSNVFCQDYRLAGSGFRLLRDGLHVIPARLKVPEVVVDEVVNRFQEDLMEIASAIEKAHSQLHKFLPDHPQPSLRSSDVPKAGAQYRQWLLSTLEEMGAEILPYPDIPHKQVVERDLKRLSPFKRNGAGYRDYLIWETVRRLTVFTQGLVVLVTDNRKDFGDGPRVATDLQKEIANPSRLELLLSLRQFTDAYVIPKLAMVDELRVRLQRKGPAFDIPGWLHNNLVAVLQREDYLGAYLLGFPDRVGRVWPLGATVIDVVTADKALRLSEREFWVRVRVKAEIAFSVDIDWDDYTRHQEIRDYIGESDPFTSASLNEVGTLTLGFTFVLDETGEHLIKDELQSIRGPYASADWSTW